MDVLALVLALAALGVAGAALGLVLTLYARQE